MGTGFDSVIEEPLQVSWNRRIRYRIIRIYILIDGLFQSKLEILETGDILR
jgi:hypothetical protein